MIAHSDCECYKKNVKSTMVGIVVPIMVGIVVPTMVGIVVPTMVGIVVPTMVGIVVPTMVELVVPTMVPEGNPQPLFVGSIYYYKLPIITSHFCLRT